MRRVISLIFLSLPGNLDSTPAKLNHARWLDKATKIVVSRTLDRIEWNNTQNTVLGRGKPLFAGVAREFPLKLLESKTFKSGVVALRYEPERK